MLCMCSACVKNRRGRDADSNASHCASGLCGFISPWNDVNYSIRSLFYIIMFASPYLFLLKHRKQRICSDLFEGYSCRAQGDAMISLRAYWVTVDICSSSSVLFKSASEEFAAELNLVKCSLCVVKFRKPVSCSAPLRSCN